MSTVRYNTRQMEADALNRGFSVAVWATRAGLSARTVYRFLAGDTSNRMTGAKLAKALGRKPADYILTAA